MTGQNRNDSWMEQHPVLFALAISLVVHALLLSIGVYVIGQAIMKDPELLKQIAQSPEKIVELSLKQLTATKMEAIPPKPKPQEQPLLFIDVDPSQFTTEVPKNPKYYAANTTLAANPDNRIDSTLPKIEGQQTKIVRAFDAPRSTPKPQPLHPDQPAPAKVQPDPARNTSQARPLQPSPAKSMAREKPAQNEGEKQKKEKGDLAKLRPELGGQPDVDPPTEAAHTRPRTLAEARHRLQSNLAPGEMMKQNGGVKRHADISSLAAIGTPLGNYDARIIDAIRTRWFALMDQNNTSSPQGTVVVEFRLYSNGTVRNVRIAEENVGSLFAYYCQSAIMDPAPYDKWSPEVKAAVGSDYRDVKFRFIYQ